jgi:hypothetical protein
MEFIVVPDWRRNCCMKSSLLSFGASVTDPAYAHDVLAMSFLTRPPFSTMIFVFNAGWGGSVKSKTVEWRRYLYISPTSIPFVIDGKGNKGW